MSHPSDINGILNCTVSVLWYFGKIGGREEASLLTQLCEWGYIINLCSLFCRITDGMHSIFVTETVEFPYANYWDHKRNKYLYYVFANGIAGQSIKKLLKHEWWPQWLPPLISVSRSGSSGLSEGFLYFSLRNNGYFLWLERWEMGWDGKIHNCGS